MPKNDTILIVDGNNRAWAAFHAYSRLSYRGKSVSMIYGLPSMLKGLMTKFKTNNMIVAWDYKGSDMRKKLYPDYKGERKHKALVDYEDWKDQQKVVKRLIYFMGIRQSFQDGWEADDIIYRFVQRSKTKGYKRIIIVSGDKDFNQLVDDQVQVYSESKKLLITKENMKGIFGYHPHQTVDYLILCGDDSDNIKGYPKIGHGRATQLLSKFNSLADFIKSDEGVNLINKKSLLELISGISILIHLSDYHNKYLKNQKPAWYKEEPNPKFNKEKFIALCAKFNMNKLMGTSFIKTISK